MPTRLRFLYSGLAFIVLVIPATQIFGELSRRSDIWWTPLPLATSLAQSRDRVEIYARGKPLDALLEAGQLRVADQAGSTALGANEITVRFNNWDRVRAERVPMLLLYAGAFGVGLALLFAIPTPRRRVDTSSRWPASSLLLASSFIQFPRVDSKNAPPSLPTHPGGGR